jgi:hypothetical protein
VQVHFDEGVAIHIGPEPCVGVCKDADEASVGEGIGQPLSRESQSPGCRRCFERGRQHVSDAPSQGPNGPAWSKNLACAEAPWTGTGRSHVWPAAVHRSGPHREGEEP